MSYRLWMIDLSPLILRQQIVVIISPHYYYCSKMSRYLLSTISIPQKSSKFSLNFVKSVDLMWKTFVGFSISNLRLMRYSLQNITLENLNYSIYTNGLNCSSSSSDILYSLTISSKMVARVNIYLRARSQRTSSVVPSGCALPLKSSMARWASSEVSNFTTLIERKSYWKHQISAD